MSARLAVLILALAAAAWPVTAGAVRFMDESGPQTTGTIIDGFPEVLGPSGTEPEHAGQFIHPPAGPPIPVSPAAGPQPPRPAPAPGPTLGGR